MHVMNEKQRYTIDRMNVLGKEEKPFVFLIDYEFENPLIFDFNNSDELLWKTPERSNYITEIVPPVELQWTIYPVDYQDYEQAFALVQERIHNGDTYLLNLTMPAKVETNLSLEEMFHLSNSPYKIWLRDQFVCFSPEIFVRIKDGIISSYPMKGTIDAAIENAEQQLLNDEKEVAEHHTIVDLIRNDLSIVATDVSVEQFMYIDRIHTNTGDLLQMSSHISGKLPENYQQSIGSIIDKLFPAGSICGAPKEKTVEIIKSAETYIRGYYTGIFGVFDGKNLDSCVLIRYVEQDSNQLTFKSGGGITFLSNCKSEYNELIQKIYVPIA
jgi:para-aminobenzoate synthetase component 1